MGYDQDGESCSACRIVCEEEQSARARSLDDVVSRVILFDIGRAGIALEFKCIIVIRQTISTRMGRGMEGSSDAALQKGGPQTASQRRLVSYRTEDHASFCASSQVLGVEGHYCYLLLPTLPMFAGSTTRGHMVTYLESRAAPRARDSNGKVYRLRRQVAWRKCCSLGIACTFLYHPTFTVILNAVK